MKPAVVVKFTVNRLEGPAGHNSPGSPGNSVVVVIGNQVGPGAVDEHVGLGVAVQVAMASAAAGVQPAPEVGKVSVRST